ncbi:MAG TPA: DUF4097 family beta strand repeat-containing protein [Steroidobacteraceae bacterium]|jgi:DUF4097 and DUF4098 domain-containing protein YvlB|nr:DUF4097 family beta strand repeat-containing protein [Steroidobacteraceae bacterium]
MSIPKSYLCAGLLVALPLLACAGESGSIDRRIAVEPGGEVIISNVSGSIDVRGWDRNEVQVTGHLGEDVERLDLTTSGGRTIVKVVLPRGSSNDGDAEISVQVPKNCSVEVSAVSADVSSQGVLGTQRLKSVSGEITADISGDDSEVRSVSGDLTVRGTGKPISLRANSVSGSLDLTNGAGKLDVVTVSGDARVQMGETSEVRGRTTSGDLELRAKLTRDGRVDVEGVSGEITLRLVAPGGLSTEIESFSGDIEGCLAGSVERVSKYGPGTRLNLRTVEGGGARVRAKTLSGDIDICDH